MTPVSTISVSAECCSATKTVHALGLGELFSVPLNKVMARTNNTKIIKPLPQCEWYSAFLNFPFISFHYDVFGAWAHSGLLVSCPCHSDATKA